MRNANIELLRIVSMVLIVLFHFSVHGTWPEGGPLASDTAVEMLSFGGKLGVNCFVLITGYFMVHGHLKVQSLLRVMLQTWFYSFAILAISAIAQPDLVTPERLREAVTPSPRESTGSSRAIWRSWWRARSSTFCTGIWATVDAEVSWSSAS